MHLFININMNIERNKRNVNKKFQNMFMTSLMEASYI